MKLISLIGVVTGIGAGLALMAQSSPTAKSGAYTAEQATAGEAAYKADCASCHGEKLEGSGRQIPPLAGEDFLVTWTPQSVGDLFERVQETMPADRPGQLSPERNAQIVAYMLKMNGYPAGQTQLPASAAAVKKIPFGK